MNEDRNEASEGFSHIDGDEAQMVNVSDKPDVRRSSVATGKIELRESTVEAVREGDVVKGNVLATARVAGIQAVKRTWDTVPMCHQIPVSDVSVGFEFEEDGIRARVEVRSTGKTGVEMEALNGVSTALLTVWDMVKSAEKEDAGGYPETAIGGVEVVEKVKGEGEGEEG